MADQTKKYEAPAAVPLGDVAKGQGSQGRCFVGSVAGNTCTVGFGVQGSASDNTNCFEGGLATANLGCHVGTQASPANCYTGFGGAGAACTTGANPGYN